MALCAEAAASSRCHELQQDGWLHGCTAAQSAWMVEAAEGVSRWHDKVLSMRQCGTPVARGQLCNRSTAARGRSAITPGGCDARLVALEAEQLRWRKEAGALSCNAHSVGPNGGFCLGKKRKVGGNFYMGKSLARHLSTLFEQQDVLDIGCGLGQSVCWLRVLVTSPCQQASR